MYRLSTAIIILFLTSGLYGNAVIKKSELHSLLNEQQKIAKNFSAYYKKTQKDNKQARKKMKIFINTFGKNQNKLSRHKYNNKLIKQTISSINKRWIITEDLSKKTKHDGIIEKTMSEIEEKIEKLRKLYSKAY